MKKLCQLYLAVCCLLLLCSCSAGPAAQPDDAASPAPSASEPASGAPEAAEDAEAAENTSDAPQAPGGKDEPAAQADDAASGPDAGSVEEPQDAPSDAPQDAPPAGQTSVDAAAPEEPPEGPPVPPDATPAGPWEFDGALYYVQEDGTCLTDGSIGYLTFGADGRYTSGDAELDQKILALLETACPDPAASAETRLQQVYTYIRDNYRYLSMPHYEAGSTYWGNSAALTMLTQGKGNCYNFTALFTACARQLGYQAYNVAGQEYSPPTTTHGP